VTLERVAGSAAAKVPPLAKSTWRFFTRSRFIDLERPALEGFAVQRLYCGLSAFLAVHRYEGESTRAARFPVVDNLGLHHDAVRRKEFHEVSLRHVEGQVADKQSCFYTGLE